VIPVVLILLPIIKASLGSFIRGEEEGGGDMGVVPGIHHSSFGQCWNIGRHGSCHQVLGGSIKTEFSLNP
jgi:hypothetical protein